MTLDSFVDAGFSGDYLDGFTVLRAREVVDPYDPESVLGEDWTNPETFTVEGYLDSRGSSVDAGEVREQLSVRRTLVLFDPAVDIRVGDRVQDVAGTLFTVANVPERDRNPFTGWQPTLVVELEAFRG